MESPPDALVGWSGGPHPAPVLGGKGRRFSAGHAPSAESTPALFLSVRTSASVPLRPARACGSAHNLLLSRFWISRSGRVRNYVSPGCWCCWPGDLRLQIHHVNKKDILPPCFVQLTHPPGSETSSPPPRKSEPNKSSRLLLPSRRREGSFAPATEDSVHAVCRYSKLMPHGPPSEQPCQ